jgi:D-alanyl-D-alanine carboxypeptidase/D-alanyl-D-alanine-endopeptidase (penicillin-binding protein 4)
VRDFASRHHRPISRPISRRHALTRVLGAALIGSGVAAPGPAAAARTAASARKAAGPRLPPELQERLAATGLAAQSFGLYAQPVAGGTPLLAWQAERALALASTAKLVTTVAALDLLGPTFRWTTSARLTGPVDGGRLLGDLVIVGGGDATLESAQVLAWLRQLRAAGLSEVLGDIVLDRRRFQLAEADLASTPTPAADRPHHVRPDALMLDGGAVHVQLQAAGRGAPRIDITPPLGAALRVVNAVQPQRGCAAEAQYREHPGSAGELRVQGAWTPDCPPRALQLAPLEPAELTRRAFGELWRQAGGRLLGEVREARPADALGGSQPPGSELRSEPLGALLRDMNKTSNNLIARHLLLSLAPDFPQRPATLAAAQARVRGWLDARGLDAQALALDSGSGLSRADRGSPRALVDLLRGAALGPTAQALLASLPVAGVDGTLEHRLRGGAAQGQAWLKTGTLLDARSLAGYVRNRRGQLLAVALICNDAQAAQATPALDACIEWLARRA